MIKQPLIMRPKAPPMVILVHLVQDLYTGGGDSDIIPLQVFIFQ